MNALPIHLQIQEKWKKQFPMGPWDLWQSHFNALPAEYFLDVPEKATELHLQLWQSSNWPLDGKWILDENKQILAFTGPDRSGVFSLLAGLVTSLGLDIERGGSYSYTLPSPYNKSIFSLWFLTRKSSHHLIDVWKDEVSITSYISASIAYLNAIWIDPHTSTAREWIYRKIIPILQLGQKQTNESEFYNIDIQFFQEEFVTRIDVKGKNGPGFLFALTNALALKGIDIRRVSINTEGDIAHDILWIADSHGKPITQIRQLEQLRAAVALIKQFTFLLPLAPDPMLAFSQFEFLLNQLLDDENTNEKSLSLFSTQTPLRSLATALGSGTHLWEQFLKVHSENFLPLLRRLDELKWPRRKSVMQSELANILLGLPSIEEKINQINIFKDRELLRIDLLYLIYPNRTFMEFASELTDLAEVTMNAAIHVWRDELAIKYGYPMISGRRALFALCALGKFGGRELGYASDLELILIYEAEGETDHASSSTLNSDFFSILVRKLRASIEVRNDGIFSQDWRLRPHGEKGALATSLSAFSEYYGPNSAAYDFERQALIKLRPIYGDQNFSDLIMEARNSCIYSDVQIPITHTLELRKKQITELTNQAKINAKYSPGGLCEVEYGIQFMQLMYGQKTLSVRLPSTITAMEALLESGYLSAGEFEKLFSAYAFQRRLINALRMVRGEAKDLELPPYTSDSYTFLCKRLGYLSRNQMDIKEQLKQDIETHFNYVSHFFASKFVGDLKDVEIEPGLAELLSEHNLSATQTQKILASYGFLDHEHAKKILHELWKESHHNPYMLSVLVMSKRFLQLSPCPEKVISDFAQLMEQKDIADRLLRQILFHPRFLEVLFFVFGQGNYLSNIIVNYPFLLHYAANHSSLSLDKVKTDYLQEINELLATQPSIDDQLENLRIFQKRELLRIGIRDKLLHTPLESILAEISGLADALLQTISTILIPSHLLQQICVVALGKYGGQELNYSSDIDLIFVCTEHLPDEQRSQLQIALRKWVNAITLFSQSGQLYRVDLNLRPWGAQGDLICTPSQIHFYYQNNAAGWELQAWIKARAVSGNIELGNQLIHDIWNLTISEERKHSLRKNFCEIRLKTLSEITATELAFNIKQNPGGLRTIEFYTQSLQIEYGNRYPSLVGGHTIHSLQSLIKWQVLPPEKGLQLIADYTFLRQLEHSIQLEAMRQYHSLPKDLKELEILARRMGFEEMISEKAAPQLLRQLKGIYQRQFKISAEIFPGSEKYFELPNYEV